MTKPIRLGSLRREFRDRERESVTFAPQPSQPSVPLFDNLKSRLALTWAIWLPVGCAVAASWIFPQIRWLSAAVGLVVGRLCIQWSGRGGEDIRQPEFDLVKQKATAEPATGDHVGEAVLWETVLATMQEGVLVVDPQEQVLYVNPAGRRMLEIADRNVEGRWTWEVVRHAILRETAASILRTGQEQQVEIDLARTPRVVLSVWGTRLSVRAANGVVLVMADITQLRQQEQLRREFVAQVSHELKTPLTSIQACADTLLEGALDDASCNRTFVESILEQSERLQSLIQNMLRLAKLEAQAEVFQWDAVDVGAVIDECVEALRPLALQRDLEIRWTDKILAAQVHADREGVRTILSNLMVNAINYTPENGRVEVTAGIENEAAEVWFAVSDTGVGIAEEHQQRIFERFYRADKSRTRAGSQGGVGLGLAIVKQLVEAFHGKIEVDSQPERGSRFVVRLPLLDSHTRHAG